MKFVLLILIFLSLPGFSQEDDERFLDELEADRRSQVEAHVKLDETHQKLKSQITDLPAELGKLGYESLNTAALLDEKVINLIKDALKQSPLRNSSPDEVKTSILKQAEGSFIHGYLSDSPKLMNALVAVLRDDEALTSAMGIFLRKDDLKIYFFIWIGFMILAWLFKKIFFNKNWTAAKRKMLGITVSVAFGFMSLTTFYNMFHKELSPTAKILLDHWRRRNL